MGFSFHVGRTKQYTRNSYNNIKIKIIAGIFMILMGITFLGGVIFLLNYEKNYVETKGVVIDHYERYDYDSHNYMYKEIIQYTVDGETYSFASSTTTTHPKSIGSVVTIKYDANDPEKVVFGSGERNWVFGVVGSVLSLGGTYILVLGLKDRYAYKKAVGQTV